MNILILSTYPADPPSHGGQHRVWNIAQAYRKAGHAVQLSGVLGSGGFPAAPGYAAYPANARLSHVTGESPQLEELLIGELFAAPGAYFDELAALVDAPPDLIEVHQPWLMQFALRYRAQHAPQAKLVYSSQNIEHAMKFEIIRFDRGLAAAEAARKKIAACEVAAIEAADAVVCVSQTDLDWTRRYTNAPLVLAPNGVPERSSSAEGSAAALALTEGRRFALFCASAHPPNMNGFFDIAGPSIGAIAPDQKIVIAGGAGPAIVEDERYAGVGGLARMAVIAGTVPETTLQGLLESAHAIILPITQGGGTNLKTAEALWNGKHVIATPMAMRGYESWSGARGLTIAGRPQDFLAALRRAMQAAPLQLSADEQEQRRSLLWEATLKLLPPFAAQLVHPLGEAA